MEPRPCLRCGYCCKKAPCAYGSPGAGGSCRFLEGSGPGSYSCGLFAEISFGSPDSELSPAFGAGCSSSLNTDRQAVKGRAPQKLLR